MKSSVRAKTLVTLATIVATTTYIYAGDLPVPGDQPPPPRIIHCTPPGFEVVRLSDEFGIHSRPSINNEGDVVWSLGFPLDDISDVYQFRDGWIWPVTNDDLFNVNPMLGNSGKISWFIAEGSLGPYGVATLGVSMETEIITHSGNAIGWIGTNDYDWLVWSDDLSDDASEVNLCAFDGTTTVQVAANGLSNQVPRTNVLGDVVFTRKDTAAIPSTSDVVLISKGNLILLTPVEQQGASPDMNDARQVVFADRFGGVLLWQDGEATIIDETGATPVINNRGTIAFSRPNGNIREVVLHMDEIEFVLPSKQYSVAHMSINDRDELAWRGFDFEKGGISAIFLMRRIAPRGDFNHDCKIDFFDYSIFQKCFTGVNAVPEDGLPGTCTRADFDDDGDVDLEDVSSFIDSATGSAASVAGCEV